MSSADSSLPDGDPTNLLDEEKEGLLAEALRSAYAPVEIDATLNARLVDLALEDPDAVPSDDEVVESERLRAALEGVGEHPSAVLARALSAAAAPVIEADTPFQRLADEAAGSAPARTVKTNVLYVAFGAGAAIAALAASLALWLRPAGRSEAPSGVAATERAEIAARVAISRSTAPLFAERFEIGKASRRMDRIVAARERDLRTNRFASWGIR